jgi:hypothetical protein
VCSSDLVALGVVAGEGGDPGDDAERYALLSTSGDDDTPTGPENADDYRILISTGPIERCGVDDETGLRLALAVGAGSNGLLTNATQAYLTALGRFFDRDADPQTGDDGREYRVAWIPPGQGRTVASGVYLVRLVTDRGVDTRRIVLAR